MEQASATLGYALDRWHLALVVWHEPGTNAAPSELQRTAARLLAGSGCSATLVVPHGAASVWVWAAWRSRPAELPPLAVPADSAYRIKKIEDRTGRDLRHRRLELECALRLARVLGLPFGEER